jgi:hypothetical protein
MSEPDYDKIRRRVEERFNKQKELTIHTAVYLVINLLMWGLWLTGLLDSIPVIGAITGPLGTLAPLVISIGWGVGLIAHFLDYYFSAGGGARRREQAIQREIERERALMNGDYSKPKRDQHMRLTEDGELEALTDDDEEYAQPSRRSRRS